MNKQTTLHTYMSYLKCWFFLLFFALCATKGFSQGSYFATDSAITTGIKILAGPAHENARFIRVKQNDNNVKTYTPEDITEFAFGDGRTFKALAIEENGQTVRYFLEELYKGQFSLYYLVKKDSEVYYLVTGDSSAPVEIPAGKDGFIEYMTAYVADCPASSKNIRFLSLNRNSLVRFFKDYGTCSDSHLPRFRAGLYVGVGANRFEPGKSADLLSVPEYEYHSGIFIGAFFSSPLEISNFSVVSGPVLQQYRSSVPFKEKNTSYDLVVNQWRLKLPLLLRYTSYKLNPPPFVEFGLVYSGRLSGTSSLFDYQVSDNNIFINVTEQPALPKHQLGLAIGGGMLFKYDSNYSFQIHYGYNRLYPVTKQRETLITNEFFIGAGFLF